MRKELKKGDTEYEIFNDYWKIVKEYNIPEDADEYWESLIYTGDEFVKKYDCQFAHDIMLAFIGSRDALLKKSLL